MAEKIVSVEDRIKPAVITDTETGEQFTLDFSRDSIRFAEAREFMLEDVTKYPQTKISELFFYAFRMHHSRVAKDKTDKLIAKWGGLPEKLLTRLIQLYTQAQTSNTIQTDEDAEKNAVVTLELL